MANRKERDIVNNLDGKASRDQKYEPAGVKKLLLSKEELDTMEFQDQDR